MDKRKIQLIEREVPSAGASVKILEELDRDYLWLTGIAFLDNIGLNCLLVSSVVDGTELFPRDFEVAFLQSNVFVPPNERFFTLPSQKADGNRIEMEFLDGGTAPAYPYTLKIYLLLETPINPNS